MEGLSVDTYLTSVRRSRSQCFIGLGFRSEPERLYVLLHNNSLGFIVFDFCISICSGRLVTCVKEIRI